MKPRLGMATPVPYWKLSLHAGDSDYMNRIADQEAKEKELAKKDKEQKALQQKSKQKEDEGRTC